MTWRCSDRWRWASPSDRDPLIYMAFNSDGAIRVMTIAAIDLQPLIDGIRSAAQTGVVKAA